MAVRKQGLVTSPALTPQSIIVPRAGMLATVRNRRGVVAAVEPFDGETGRLHLVHLEYKDERAPSEERILWEIEPDRHLLEPNALPTPAHDGGAMPAEDFDALLRAARWSALSPYLDPAGGEGPPPREPVASPFHGGVCVESYQLAPLLKALRMPRVSLLIADDVGLGKTVEAGLILTELLLRRRIQRVLVLTRRRYPGGGSEVSRWTVRSGGVPDDADAVVLLSIEELAVNELRETFHRWVRTLALPVRDAEIGIPLDHVPARIRRDAPEVDDPDERERACEIIDEVSAGLRTWLRAYKDELTKRLALQLGIDGKAARGREDERYRQRQGEVSALIEQSTLARLTREIEQLRERGRQGQLFDETERLAEIEQSIEQKQDELTCRRQHYEEIRDQLQRERTRILDHLLPARFAMAGNAQAFPVAVEVRLPDRRP